MNNRSALTYIFTILFSALVVNCTSVDSKADVNLSPSKPIVQKSDSPTVVAEVKDMSNTQKDTIVKKKSVEKPDVNRFNRLLKKGGEVHLAPIEDGIHDPTNRAARMLQNPKEALFGFPEAKAGNEVDWVKAMDSGKIKPLNSYDGKEVMPIVMDLNIVMEVKGSMPNVVFPHKQHTTILDCANCHPAIFTPLSGSNNITMAENLMGKKCGVCHGKVAFPLSKCSSCHSGEK